MANDVNIKKIIGLEINDHLLEAKRKKFKLEELAMKICEEMSSLNEEGFERVDLHTFTNLSTGSINCVLEELKMIKVSVQKNIEIKANDIASERWKKFIASRYNTYISGHENDAINRLTSSIMNGISKRVGLESRVDKITEMIKEYSGYYKNEFDGFYKSIAGSICISCGFQPAFGEMIVEYVASIFNKLINSEMEVFCSDSFKYEVDNIIAILSSLNYLFNDDDVILLNKKNS